MNDQLKKLKLLKDAPALAIWDSINELNDSVKQLIDLEKEPKPESISVDNLSDAQTDLTPLERNFEALKASVESVVTAIQAIPQDKEMDMSGVEKLLKQIADSSSGKMETSHMKKMSKDIDSLLFAVQTIASKSEEPIEVSLKLV